MSSATIICTILLAAGCLFLPKRYFLLPYIMAACLIPTNQRAYLGSLDFTVLRILVFAGMLRFIFSSDKETIHWHGFDKLVLAWNISSTIIYTIQFGTMAAFLNRCGFMYDSLGIYWICRYTFRSIDDIIQCIRLFAICAILSTPLVALEKYYQTSVLSVFGPTGSAFHRGRFRCAGPFPHFIMLGCFWASLVPLFYSSWKAQVMPKLGVVGMFCALILVYLSASSTPLLTLVAIFCFWMCYSIRAYGKIVFLAFCGLLTFLHIVMNAPVWHLMSRANIFGGSTGWHRFYLFDQFVARISEWFFLGTTETAHWGLGLVDITNQYVLEAVRGGFLTLLIFIIMLYKSVEISGQSSLFLAAQPKHWIAWGVCVSLLGHIVSFWGTSYFGQILMLMYMVLAMVGFFHEININKSLSTAEAI